MSNTGSGPYQAKGGYEILNPNLNYRGKSYSLWACDWFNWLLAADADKHTFGPVVFLRANLTPNSTSKVVSDIVYGLDKKAELVSSYQDDPYYPKNYTNLPNVKVAGDRLEIFEDQAVFWPIITTYEIATKPYIDFGLMQDYCGPLIDYGDDPPDQSLITIDTNPIKFDIGIQNFRITSPIFPAIAPDTEYGRSVKDFLEMNLPYGHYFAMVEGYFLMIKFNSGHTYALHSIASAPRETRGPYVAELLYEITVHARDNKRSFVPPVGITGIRSERHSGVITQILSEKVKTNELEDVRANFLLECAGIPKRIGKDGDRTTIGGNTGMRKGQDTKVKKKSRR